MKRWAIVKASPSSTVLSSALDISPYQFQLNISHSPGQANRDQLAKKQSVASFAAVLRLIHGVYTVDGLTPDPVDEK